MGKLLNFTGNRAFGKSTRPQITEPNQHVRNSWLRQFAIGKSTMALARQNKVKMSRIEQEIRRELYELRGRDQAA